MGKILSTMRINKMDTQTGKQKLSQKKLAKAIGICRETVCAIERGHKTQVDGLHLDTMAAWIKECDLTGIAVLKKELGALVVSKINGAG